MRHHHIKVRVIPIQIRMCASCGRKPATNTVIVTSWDANNSPVSIYVDECQACSNQSVNTATECLDRDEESR